MQIAINNVDVKRYEQKWADRNVRPTLKSGFRSSGFRLSQDDSGKHRARLPAIMSFRAESKIAYRRVVIACAEPVEASLSKCPY